LETGCQISLEAPSNKVRRGLFSHPLFAVGKFPTKGFYWRGTISPQLAKEKQKGVAFSGLIGTACRLHSQKADLSFSAGK
jgi:hypothetical protein